MKIDLIIRDVFLVLIETGLKKIWFIASGCLSLNCIRSENDSRKLKLVQIGLEDLANL